MSDLISRSALLERWKYKFDHSKSLEECIMTQPTAYNVDAVEKQMTKEFKKHFGVNWDKAPYLVKAIGIVRSGGKE